MLDWLRDHPQFLWMLGLSLAIGLVASMVGLIVAVRMPPDALTRKPRRAGGAGWKSLARNILGWLLILAGILMLIFPGPGVVVLLLGITLADFPGRRRLKKWLLSRKSVIKPLNRLRKRFGQPALKAPSASTSAA